MPIYRNTITGVTVSVCSEIRGDWELVPDPLPAKAEEPAKKESKKAKKKPKK